MAQEKTQYFKLFAPDGTAVEVAGEGRAEELKKNRGYTTTKPRNPKGPVLSPDDQKAADLQAQLDEANAKIAAMESNQAGTGTPEFAPPQTGASTPAKK